MTSPFALKQNVDIMSHVNRGISRDVFARLGGGWTKCHDCRIINQSDGFSRGDLCFFWHCLAYIAGIC